MCVSLCVLVPVKDRLALCYKTKGTLTFSLTLNSQPKIKTALVFLVATLSHQYIQDGCSSHCLSVCVCVKRNIAKEKGGDLMSQQWNRVIKENPKTTHLPPDETLSITAKAQQCACGQMCVCMSMFILKSIAQNYLSERLTSICHLLLVPYLFLFHLLRINACNSVEMGSMTDKRKCLSIILFLSVRGFEGVCLTQEEHPGPYLTPGQPAAPFCVC